jgi:hypothetical protein
MVRGTRWPAQPSRFPSGLQVGFGALAVLSATMIGAMFPPSVWWRAVPVAIAVFAFAMLSARPGAVAFTAVLAYLLVIGFLVNRFGQLSWHGAADGGRLLLIGAAAGFGLLAGAGRGWYHRHRPLTVPVAWSVPAPARRAERLHLREDLRSG